MKIYSDDGKQFDSVEECRDYEDTLRKSKAESVYQSQDVRFYQVYLANKMKNNAPVVLVVHAKSNHDIISAVLAEQKFGSKYCYSPYSNGVSEGFRQRWELRDMNEAEKVSIGKHAVESGQALIFEASDVEKLLDYSSFTVSNGSLHENQSSPIVDLCDAYLRHMMNI